MKKLEEVYTKKQIEVLKCYAKEDPLKIILSGAKRAGKTYVLIEMFLMHVASMKNKKVNFILAGTSSSSIRRNILDDMEKILGTTIRLNKA